MMGLVHAAIGSVIGTFTNSKAAAFIGGAAAHIPVDMIPHKDVCAQLDITASIAYLGYLSYKYGMDSTQVFGAMGGLAPDTDNFLIMTNILDREQAVFPTHIEKTPFPHGRSAKNNLAEVALLGAAILVLSIFAGKKDSDDKKSGR